VDQKFISDPDGLDHISFRSERPQADDLANEPVAADPDGRNASGTRLGKSETAAGMRGDRVSRRGHCSAKKGTSADVHAVEFSVIPHCFDGGGHDLSCLG
jgi:hypothetical protein